MSEHMTEQESLTDALAEHELNSYSGNYPEPPFASCTCDNAVEYRWSSREQEHRDHLYDVTLRWSDARVAEALRDAADEILQWTLTDINRASDQGYNRAIGEVYAELMSRTGGE